MAQSLDKALCEGKWAEVLSILSQDIENENIGAITLQRECRVQQLIGQVNSTGFDIVNEPYRDVVLQELKGKRISSPTHSEGTTSKLANIEELQFIEHVTTAQLHLLAGNIEDSKSVLDGTIKAPENQQSSLSSYSSIVTLKKDILEARCDELLGNTDSAYHRYTNMLESAKKDGILVNSLYYYSIKFLSRQSSGKGVEPLGSALESYYSYYMGSLDQNLSSRRALELVKLYISYSAKRQSQSMLTNVDRLKKQLEERLKGIVKVPKATDKNDSIENATEILMEIWLRNKPTTTQRQLLALKDILISAAYSTFHSCVIARNLVLVNSGLSLTQEALACFDTYVAYQDRIEVEMKKGAHMVGHVGDSLEGTIKVYACVLAIHATSNNKRDIELARNLSEALYSKIKANSVSGTNPKLLSIGYLSIANAHSRHLASVDLNEHQFSAAVSTTKNFYRLSSEADPKNMEAAFRRALFSACSLDVEDALIVTKDALLVEESHLGLWHLLALLLSTQGEHQTAFECLRAAKHVFHSNHQDLSLLSFEDKAQFLQIEMTLIALLEAQNGTEVALDHVPEVFSLYSTLFGGSNAEHSANGTAEVTTNGNAHTNGSKTITKTVTNSSVVRRLSLQSKGDKSRHSLKLQRGKEAEKNTVVLSKNQKLLLEDLWLWAAAIYRHADQLDQAEEAILEAEKVVGTSAKTHTQLGFLMSVNRPIHAMEEFQAALELEKNDLEATIGLAQLVLQYSHLGTSLRTKESDKDKDKDKARTSSFTLFISKKDEVAAHARVRGLLERHVRTSPGRETSEAWWLLSEFYSKVEDTQNAKKALWKCIAIEEARPVRSFVHCAKIYA